MVAQAFEEFGTVTEAAVIMERDNPMRSRGFGFVTFDDADVAQVRLPIPQHSTTDGRG